MTRPGLSEIKALALSSILLAALGCTKMPEPSLLKNIGSITGGSDTIPNAGGGPGTAGSSGGTTGGSAGGGSGIPATPPAGYQVASHFPLPQLLDNGGGVLTNPVFIPIVYSDDSMASQLSQFMSAFAVSNAWKAMTREYGVGAPNSRPMITLSASSPATMDDQDIRAWLKQYLHQANSPAGAPDSAAIYILFYSDATNITMGGSQACESFAGYHSWLTDAQSGKVLSYAVIPRCSGLSLTTQAASHELAEAATDPHGDGFNGTSDDYAVWEDLTGSENGDLCEGFKDSFYTSPEIGFGIQRTWSNVAAAAGMDPCVPMLPNEIYFNSVPLLSDSVNYTSDGSTYKVKGIQIPVGQSKDIEIDLYSSAPTSAWHVSASEHGSGNDLSLGFDKTSGTNGDKLKMTVTVNSQDPDHNAEIVVVKSTSSDGTVHAFPFVIGN